MPSTKPNKTTILHDLVDMTVVSQQLKKYLSTYERIAANDKMHNAYIESEKGDRRFLSIVYKDKDQNLGVLHIDRSQEPNDLINNMNKALNNFSKFELSITKIEFNKIAPSLLPISHEESSLAPVSQEEQSLVLVNKKEPRKMFVNYYDSMVAEFIPSPRMFVAQTPKELLLNKLNALNVSAGAAVKVAQDSIKAPIPPNAELARFVSELMGRLNAENNFVMNPKLKAQLNTLLNRVENVSELHASHTPAIEKLKYDAQSVADAIVSMELPKITPLAVEGRKPGIPVIDSTRSNVELPKTTPLASESDKPSKSIPNAALLKKFDATMERLNKLHNALENKYKGNAKGNAVIEVIANVIQSYNKAKEAYLLDGNKVTFKRACVDPLTPYVLNQINTHRDDGFFSRFLRALKHFVTVLFASKEERVARQRTARFFGQSESRALTNSAKELYACLEILELEVELPEGDTNKNESTQGLSA